MSNICKILGVKRLPLLMVAASLFLSGCTSEPAPQPQEPIYHCENYDIWPDSIDNHSGLILKAIGDSLLQVRVEGTTLREIAIAATSGNVPTVHTGLPVFDALYRLESTTAERGSYTSLTPYELYLNPLNSGTGITLLESREKNGYIVPFDTKLYSWPIINDNPQWLLAAAELYKTSGNSRWLRKVGEVAKRVTGEDYHVARHPQTELIGGAPRHLAIEGRYPTWMEPIDILNSESALLNMTYWGAINSLETITAEMAKRNLNSHLPELAFDAETMRQAIIINYWQPDLHTFAAMNYGSATVPVTLTAADNMAQALAIISELCPSAMANSIMANAPINDLGQYTPALAAVDNNSAGTLLRTMWAIAASRTSCDEAFNAATGALLLNTAGRLLENNARATDISAPLQAFLIRALLGIKFNENSITFAPSVPTGMPGSKTIDGLRYRKYTLNITVEGVGNKIASFKLDGEVATPTIDASLEGTHTVEIRLTNSGNPAVNATERIATIPPTTAVEWLAPNKATILGDHTDDNTQFAVYANGQLIDYITDRHYEVTDSHSTQFIQIAEMTTDNNVGFSGKPHMFIPEGNEITVDLTEWALTGTRLLKDRKQGEKIVESSRWRNRVVQFVVDIPSTGDYLVDIHYLSGLGIVNAKRRTALRTLIVDGERKGVFVLPQQTVARNDSITGDDWQNITSYSNQLLLSASAGAHAMELRIYQPTPVYVDPYNNNILADRVRLIKMPSLLPK
jgi:hypothetical protein